MLLFLLHQFNLSVTSTWIKNVVGGACMWLATEWWRKKTTSTPCAIRTQLAVFYDVHCLQIRTLVIFFFFLQCESLLCVTLLIEFPFSSLLTFCVLISKWSCFISQVLENSAWCTVLSFDSWIKSIHSDCQLYSPPEIKCNRHEVTLPFSRLKCWVRHRGGLRIGWNKDKRKVTSKRKRTKRWINDGEEEPERKGWKEA